MLIGAKTLSVPLGRISVAKSRKTPNMSEKACFEKIEGKVHKGKRKRKCSFSCPPVPSHVKASSADVSSLLVQFSHNPSHPPLLLPQRIIGQPQRPPLAVRAQDGPDCEVQ